MATEYGDDSDGLGGYAPLDTSGEDAAIKLADKYNASVAEGQAWRARQRYNQPEGGAAAPPAAPVGISRSSTPPGLVSPAAGAVGIGPAGDSYGALPSERMAMSLGAQDRIDLNRASRGMEVLDRSQFQTYADQDRAQEQGRIKALSRSQDQGMKAFQLRDSLAQRAKQRSLSSYSALAQRAKQGSLSSYSATEAPPEREY